MISVIIPTFNRASLISRAVKSVINQTYRDIEIVVVDDASTDNTEDVIREIDCPFLHYIKLEENGGACRARNIGIKNAKGEYVSFLDSDDQWETDKLEKQMHFLLEKDAEMVACNFWYEKDGNKKVYIDPKHSEEFRFEELLNANCITTGAILIKKETILSIGGFDEEMPRYQDWDLVLNVAKYTKIYFLKEPLLTLYFQKNSITNSTSKSKKYYALERMFKKNRMYILNDKKAYAHFCWSMGLYSLFTEKDRIDLLKEGVFANGFNKKRFAIYFFIKVGFKNFVKQLYAKKH